MKKAAEKKTLKTTARITEAKERAQEIDDLLTDAAHLKRREPLGGSLAEEKENLGDRIRKAREMHSLTLKDLSSRTGIGVDILEQIEANKMVPPLGELIKLGKAVETKMGYFISPGVEKPMTLVRAGCRLAVSRYGKKRSEQYGYSYESLAPEKANRLMEPFLVTLVPAEVKELSTHDGQEFIFVLEGEIRAQVGDQVEILKPGDAVYYDSSCPHLVKCLGNKSAKILAVIYTGSK